MCYHDEDMTLRNLFLCHLSPYYHYAFWYKKNNQNGHNRQMAISHVHKMKLSVCQVAINNDVQHWVHISK